MELIADTASLVTDDEVEAEIALRCAAQGLDYMKGSNALAYKLSDGAYYTMTSYREAVREDLEEKYYEQNTYSRQYAIIRELEKLYPIETLPSELQDYYMENYLSVIEKNALQAEMTLEEYVLENAGTYLENLKNNYKKIIDESIRQEILIRAIAEREGIAVTEEDTDAYIENTAERLGVSADELRAYYGDDDSFSTCTGG